MRTMSMLCACLLIACGGSGEEAREPTAPMASPSTPTEDPMAAEPTAADTTLAQGEPGASPEAAAGETPGMVGGDAVAPQATPAASRARAELMSIPGDQPVGTLTFEKQGDQIVISGDFTGLKKGDKALYIHENGDCGNKGKAAGGHFNPTSAKHGPPASAERHAGDFGNLAVSADGTGTFAMTTDSISIDPDGPSSVVGKAVIIHAKKDSKSGDAGAAIACGVIQPE